MWASAPPRVRGSAACSRLRAKRRVATSVQGPLERTEPCQIRAALPEPVVLAQRQAPHARGDGVLALKPRWDMPLAVDSCGESRTESSETLVGLARCMVTRYPRQNLAVCVCSKGSNRWQHVLSIERHLLQRACSAKSCRWQLGRRDSSQEGGREGPCSPAGEPRRGRHRPRLTGPGPP